MATFAINTAYLLTFTYLLTFACLLAFYLLTWHISPRSCRGNGHQTQYDFVLFGNFEFESAPFDVGVTGRNLGYLRS